MLKPNADNPLFPERKPDRRGSYSGDFQRWANRWLDRIGAKGDRQSFHSTRHAFTDALRRAGATGEVIDGLLGWSLGNMQDRYGSGPWIMILADVVERVEYPGIDLSHLHMRTAAAISGHPLDGGGAWRVSQA